MHIPCCCSIAKFCLTLCDSMDCSMPGFPVPHHLLEFAQVHVHWIGNATGGANGKPLQYTSRENPMNCIKRQKKKKVYIYLSIILYCTYGSSQFTYCWSLAWSILITTLLVCEMSIMIVWTFFGVAFLWDWNENTFSSPVATAEFSKFAEILSAAL